MSLMPRYCPHCEQHMNEKIALKAELARVNAQCAVMQAAIDTVLGPEFSPNAAVRWYEMSNILRAARQPEQPKFAAAPECPGPDCPMCAGEACALCGAGCWASPGSVYCEHGVIERHKSPAPAEQEQPR